MPHLSLVPVIPGQGRPRSPKGFPKAEAAIWREIVSAMPDGWFTGASTPILRALCCCIATADTLAPKIAELREGNDLALLDTFTKIHERQSKLIGDLSSKLRLPPKSKW